jgi:hypothetical protein
MRSPSSKSSKLGNVPPAACEHSSTGGGMSLVTAGQLGAESLPAEPPAIGTAGRTPPQWVSRRVAAPAKKVSRGRAERRMLEVMVGQFSAEVPARRVGVTILRGEYSDA